MATLINKHNREVKIIIPNMREFREFYSDNEGVIGLFSKRDWTEVKETPSWKPTEEQMRALLWCTAHLGGADHRVLAELYEHLKKYSDGKN